MPRALRFLAALVLAVLWLPATLHCGLEASGLLEKSEAGCCAHDESGDEQTADCEQGACELVESGDYQPAWNLLKVSAPVAVDGFVWLMEIAVEAMQPPEGDAPPRAESPPELRRTWQFLARAALLPGAPSLAG